MRNSPVLSYIQSYITPKASFKTIRFKSYTIDMSVRLLKRNTHVKLWHIPIRNVRPAYLVFSEGDLQKGGRICLYREFLKCPSRKEQTLIHHVTLHIEILPSMVMEDEVHLCGKSFAGVTRLLQIDIHMILQYISILFFFFFQDANKL